MRHSTIDSFNAGNTSLKCLYQIYPHKIIIVTYKQCHHKGFVNF